MRKVLSDGSSLQSEVHTLPHVRNKHTIWGINTVHVRNEVTMGTAE